MCLLMSPVSHWTRGVCHVLGDLWHHITTSHIGNSVVNLEKVRFFSRSILFLTYLWRLSGRSPFFSFSIYISFLAADCSALGKAFWAKSLHALPSDFHSQAAFIGRADLSHPRVLLDQYIRDLWPPESLHRSFYGSQVHACILVGGIQSISPQTDLAQYPMSVWLYSRRIRWSVLTMGHGLMTWSHHHCCSHV